MNNFNQDGGKNNFHLMQKIAQLEEHVRLLNDKIEEMKSAEGSQPSESIFFYFEGNQRKVQVADILMIKSESNYSIIHTVSGDKYLTSKTLKYWQTTIKNDFIIRVHASYLINKNTIRFITHKERTIHLLSDQIVKYSYTYKHVIHEFLN
ncbi:MAG: LytTR family transcriptional regulator DNA-binding domain-containing protein [Saprospiraceae bacterium]|nr:LytTR family transcriptional regulator DNA-binding domain-containing protein [Saprospiraceae bacterium]